MLNSSVSSNSQTLWEKNIGHRVLPSESLEVSYEATESVFSFNPLLQQLVNSPSAAPLVVERFRHRSGCPNSIQAIQRAVAQLLCDSQALPTADRPFVSMGALCKFLDIAVQGNLLKHQNKRSYSIFSPPLRGVNRTGQLEITDDGPVVTLPSIKDYSLARLALAHEIGHLLLLRRDNGFDAVACQAHSTREEEALAEYAARLLLLPSCHTTTLPDFGLAKSCVYTAGTRRVTIHTAVERLKDIDLLQKEAAKLHAAILWRIDPHSVSQGNSGSLTPQWFICPNTFIPVRRCHARPRSLVAHLCSGDNGERPVEAEQKEAVSIGGLKGTYHVNAFAWGSMRQGSRLVLSLFSSL